MYVFALTSSKISVSAYSCGIYIPVVFIFLSYDSRGGVTHIKVTIDTYCAAGTIARMYSNRLEWLPLPIISLHFKCMGVCAPQSSSYSTVARD